MAAEANREGLQRLLPRLQQIPWPARRSSGALQNDRKEASDLPS